MKKEIIGVQNSWSSEDSEPWNSVAKKKSWKSFIASAIPVCFCILKINFFNFKLICF